MGKVYGIESHVLGPEETKKLYPLMNVDDVYATLYSPMDGTIDPAGYCTGLTRIATRNGAKVRGHKGGERMERVGERGREWNKGRVRG